MKMRNWDTLNVDSRQYGLISFSFTRKHTHTHTHTKEIEDTNTKHAMQTKDSKKTQ
jgi:hypothetical protein